MHGIKPWRPAPSALARLNHPAGFRVYLSDRDPVTGAEVISAVWPDLTAAPYWSQAQALARFRHEVRQPHMARRIERGTAILRVAPVPTTAGPRVALRSLGGAR